MAFYVTYLSFSPSLHPGLRAGRAGEDGPSVQAGAEDHQGQSLPAAPLRSQGHLRRRLHRAARHTGEHRRPVMTEVRP